jgi:hypothetical protein
VKALMAALYSIQHRLERAMLMVRNGGRWPAKLVSWSSLAPQVVDGPLPRSFPLGTESSRSIQPPTTSSVTAFSARRASYQLVMWPVRATSGLAPVCRALETPS